MTDADWLACEDARKLVVWLRGKASDRKLRLFVCAFWRWHSGCAKGPDCETHGEIHRALAYAEYWADHGSRPPAGSGLPFPFGFGWHPLLAKDALDAANWTIRNKKGYLTRDGTDAEEQQVFLLRDIFGNPYRPAGVEPGWLTPSVVSLAATAYDGDFGCLPILADALEDAGCTRADLLAHCRLRRDHVRGCWGIDLVLRKK
jgi:hypothetical protein